MASMEQTRETKIEELNALIETNLDAVDTLEEALGHLQDFEAGRMVRDMIGDHQNAARRLQSRVQELGGQPAMMPHASNELKESWQRIWKGGGDTEVLLALRANERVSVDGFKIQMTKENWVQTMTEESVREHQSALATELQHFQQLTDALRMRGAAVDNDEIMGAVRNAAEHVHAAINLSGTAIEAFMKWVTGSSTK